MKSDHSKISYTAVLCAKALAYNPEIPYSKEIYQKIKEKGLHKGSRMQIALANVGARVFSGIGLLMAFIEARYIGMNQVLKELRYPYVVELASGFTPRGIELAEKTKIIESDLDNVVRIKREIIDKNFRIVPLNALDKEAFMKLGRAFDSKRPVAVIHSGLWTYLNKEEQKKLTSNIRDFLKKYSKRGYWITSDIRPRSEFKNNFFRFFRKGITKKTGRPTMRFDSDEELKEFMSKFGFKVKIVDVMDKIYDKLYIPKKFNLKKADVYAQSQGMKIYIMQLK
jgi:O-methyltransferase involved in polyketide biosynthesis